jgi:hypothetical protein
MPAPTGSPTAIKDNGDAIGCCLGRLGGDRAKSGDKHIGPHPNEVGRNTRQEFRPTFRGAIDQA